MGSKSIKISENNWERLIRWKLYLRCKNMDEVIEKIFKIMPLSEMKK